MEDTTELSFGRYLMEAVEYEEWYLHDYVLILNK